MKIPTPHSCIDGLLKAATPDRVAGLFGVKVEQIRKVHLDRHHYSLTVTLHGGHMHTLRAEQILTAFGVPLHTETERNMKGLPNHITNLNRIPHGLMAARRSRKSVLGGPMPELYPGEYAPVSEREAAMLEGAQVTHANLLERGRGVGEFSFAFMDRAALSAYAPPSSKPIVLEHTHVRATAIAEPTLYDTYLGFEIREERVGAAPAPPPPAKLIDVDALNKAYAEHLKIVEIERTREAQRLRDRMYYGNW